MRPSALLELMNSLVRTGIAAPAAIRSRSWAAEYSERKVKTENTTSASRFITAPLRGKCYPPVRLHFNSQSSPAILSATYGEFATHLRAYTCTDCNSCEWRFRMTGSERVKRTAMVTVFDRAAPAVITNDAVSLGGTPLGTCTFT